MNKRDIVIGLVILAALAGFIYFRQKNIRKSQELTTPQTLSLEDQLEDAFKVKLPEDVDKAELMDVAGGTASGIATRKFESGKFTHAVLADLPDTAAGAFYQGWLVMGDNVLSTGRLREAKGGFILEFESNKDYSGYNKVVVSLEEKADAAPEKHILEGSF